MICFLIYFLLFAQAWGDNPPLIYQPRVLEDYPGCAASATSWVNSFGYPTTTTTWAPVATGGLLPPAACKTQGEGAWTLIMMVIAEFQDGNPADTPTSVTRLIPCKGESPQYHANPVLFVVADNNCVLQGSYISPLDSAAPDGDPGDAAKKWYTDALWALKNPQFKDPQLRELLYLIWTAGWTNNWSAYHPTMIGTYGAQRHDLYKNHCTCDNWMDYADQLANWSCRCAFGIDGTDSAK